MIGRIRVHTILGLGFAAAASLAELAPVVLLLRLEAPLTSILMAGLAYQAGGALARWLPGRGLAWASGALVAVGMLIAFPPGDPAWFTGLALGAWGFQAVRRRHAHANPSDKPTAAAKRTARVVGFLAAAAAPASASLGVVVLLILAASALPLGRQSEPRPHLTGHGLELAMIVHQSHYFIYCYGLLLILSETAGGPSWVGLWFGLGWLTYLSAERIWRGIPTRRALALGHCIVALCLLCLCSWGHSGWAAVFFWILTGFGGGTVYGIAELHRHAGGTEETLDVAEDIGHVGGVVFALLLVSLFGLDAWDLSGAGAVLALLTIVALKTVWRMPADHVDRRT